MTIMKNSEQYHFRTPRQFKSVDMRLSSALLEWLSKTTPDNEGKDIPNAALFQDLLARLPTAQTTDASFRRPMHLPAGWLQFSEVRLAEEWRMGRKRIHNLLSCLDAMGAVYAVFSTTHSAMTFPCVIGWTTKDGQKASMTDVGRYVETPKTD